MFGPYRLDGLIGAGAMGEVYRARDTRKNDRVVAVKRMRTALATDDEDRARFRREAELVAGLRNRNVVSIHDYGDIDGTLFVEMALVEGVDLRHVLDVEGALEPARAVRIVTHVAKALDAAHRRSLTHRDVKPSNILLEDVPDPHGVGGDPDDDEEFAYLIDFGIAIEKDAPRLTQPGLANGTVLYMAPEQASGSTTIDARADVYALGCVLYEALTGEPPFSGRNMYKLLNDHLNTAPPRPSATVPGLPRGFDDVIGRAMAKDPDDRYQSSGALARAARAVLVDAGAQARDDRGRPRETRPPASDTPVGAPGEEAIAHDGEVTAPSEMVDLGRRLAAQGETLLAQAWFETAADSGDPESGLQAMVHLAALLAEQGATTDSRAWYERAAASGHAHHAPMAMVDLAEQLERQGDQAGARTWWSRAARSGHAEAGPRAATRLQALLARQDVVSRPRHGAGSSALHGGSDGSPGLGWALAIGVGSASTRAAVVTDPDTPRPELVDLDGARRMPSVVCLGADGTLLVGRDAANEARLAPDRAEPDPFRALAAAEHVLLGGVRVATVDLVGALLSGVARRSVRAPGRPPERVVLTHPATWPPGGVEQRRLRQAAERARLGRVELLADPIAIAQHVRHAFDRVPDAGLVAVLDLGVTTLDTAVLRWSGDAVELVGTPLRDDSLGGDALDAALMGLIAERARAADVQGWTRLWEDTGLAAERARQRFRSDVTGAREMLSTRLSVDVFVPGASKEIRVTRQDVERAVEPVLRRVIDQVERSIASADATSGQLADVYLAGGATRTPRITALVADLVGRVPTTTEAPELQAALGALVAPPSRGARRAEAPHGAARGGPALRYAAQADRGLEKPANHDSIYAGPRLLAVADGGADRPYGDAASKLVVAALVPLDDEPSGSGGNEALSAAIAAGDGALRDLMAKEAALDLQSSVTALVVRGTDAYLGHAGSSRAYRLRDGELTQLTDDGPDLVGAGDRRWAVHHVTVRPDDRYLLCTDGVHRHLAHDQLHDVLDGGGDVWSASNSLVELALGRGGADNIALVVADVVDADGT
ncbi:protein kinase domain-containing protein [Actinomycetospora chlora]